MLSEIEKKINNYLMKFPIIKRVIKRMYQLIAYTFSKKIKYEGNLTRVTPLDEYEYFFGYYDKSPWDISERYMLCLRVKNTNESVAPKEAADIVIIDTEQNNKIIKIASTNTWNVQQGCMLQWRGPNYANEIIYNDFINGQYCSIILNVLTREEKVINMPVYSVSSDGDFALSLDFSRLHRMRKGYGYSNLPEETKDELLPDTPCIWYVDLEKNKIQPILYYKNLIELDTREDMIGAEHKVNHIMISPDNTRFMFLHRWYVGAKKYTRLVTANVDGTDLFNLNDHDMTSHCYWKNDSEIIAFANRNNRGAGYYLFNDQSDEVTPIWTELKSDGHPSYSPNGKYAVTDTYPDRARVSKVYVMNNDEINLVAKVFAPFRYDNDFRCDLHPRWNRSSSAICIDSVFEGKRALYVIKGVDKHA